MLPVVVEEIEIKHKPKMTQKKMRGWWGATQPYEPLTEIDYLLYNESLSFNNVSEDYAQHEISRPDIYGYHKDGTFSQKGQFQCCMTLEDIGKRIHRAEGF